MNNSIEPALLRKEISMHITTIIESIGQKIYWLDILRFILRYKFFTHEKKKYVKSFVDNDAEDFFILEKQKKKQ